MAGLQKHDVELDPKYDNYDYPVVAPVPAKGHPGWTTKDEDAKLFQLRSMLEAEGYKDGLDTLTLLRFLRARKFDVQLAKTMFVNNAKWRKEFGGGVDNLVRNFDYKEKPQVSAYYPQYYHKTDKDGRPVYIEHLGKIDLKALNKITTDERMLQNLVVEYEKMADPRLPACSRKAGHLLETSCSILDAKGVGLTSAGSVYGYLQRASGVSQDNYPERLGKMYIINAPWGFGAVWTVVKKFLDPVTVDKIHILGSGYKSELLTQVPAENLPSSLGGTCKCPGGCELSDMGPWHEKEWARPPKWAQPAAGDNAIHDSSTLSGSSGVPSSQGVAHAGSAPGQVPAGATHPATT